MSEAHEIVRKATIVAHGDMCDGNCPHLATASIHGGRCALFAANLEAFVSEWIFVEIHGALRCPACLAATEGLKPKEQGHEVR